MKTPEYIYPHWPVPKHIISATTTRTGGHSKGIYQSLNLGSHVKDNQQNVNQNRALVKSDLHLPNDPVWLEQVHGSHVINLTKQTPKNKIADAAYTNEVGVVCVVLTADCLPVLFCDESGEFIAVAHAGWRGLVNGVLENTLQVLPPDNKQIMCWLGPAIGPNKFEVGQEVVEAFISLSSIHENAFQEINEVKALANIYQIARNVLTTQGVSKIYGGEYCTYSNDQKFYSYRRDGETGRMATLIWKQP